MKSMFLIALVSCAACKSTSYSDESRAIQAVVHAQEAAWNRGDIAGFMAEGYWNSSDLAFYSGGDVTHGFEPVLARYVKRYKSGDAEMGKLAFTDVEVLPLGEDAGIARGRWALDFEKQPDVAGLFTLVFRRMSAGWRIVHDHTSVGK